MSDEKRLIIRTSPETEAATIAERLQQIAAEADEGVVIQVCSDTGAARDMLKSDEAAILCQIYTAPERFLCHAIQQGKDLGSALGAWAVEAREILSLQRQHRRRSLLFEATHLCRYSTTGLARLGLSSGDVTLSAAITALPSNAPILDLIARAHLQAQPDVVSLREELDVSAQLLSNDATLVPPLSAELALQNYQAQTLRLAEAEHASETAKDQTAMTLQSLQVLKEEAAVKDAKLREQQEQLDQAKAESDSLGAQLAERDATLRLRQEQLDLLKSERESLGAQLAEAEHARETAKEQTALSLKSLQVLKEEMATREANLREKQKQLDQARAKSGTLGSKLAERDGQITELSRDLQEQQEHAQALEAEIDRIMTSRSMRITIPLRRLGALFRRTPND